MCTEKDYKKIKLNGLFLKAGLRCLSVLCYYWVLDYFHTSFNQMLKSLSCGSFNLRIEK